MSKNTKEIELPDRIMVLFQYIAVVKKTFRYSNVFFYNHLYQPSVFRNLFMKSGIKCLSVGKQITLESMITPC